jgi:leucine dehydrogenase
VDRGITWAPDFVANAGGIINIDVELEQAGYDPRRATQRVKAIGPTIAQILAAKRAKTPLEAAYALAEARLRAAGQP